MPLPQLSIYKDKKGKPLISNMDEPNAKPLPAGKIPKLGGGGTPQSRYADQQAQLASRSQYEQEVAAARAQNARNAQILSSPQTGMLDSAIETAIQAGQKDMSDFDNRINAKYAGQQLDKLLGAKSASESLAQRATEAQQNSLNQQAELQQRQSALNNPGQGLSRHFESTAEGIMAIDPLTGIAKPVMGADGKPIARAQTDLELQQKIMNMRMGGKTAQAVEQGTAMLPIEQQRANIKNQSELEKEQMVKQRDALGTIDILKQAESLIPIATGSGAGANVDAAQAFFGGSNQGAESASQLKILGGYLTSKVPKMSGPQSDKDAALYREMAGSLGDATIPTEIKQANLKTLYELNQKYAAENPVTQQQPTQQQQYHPAIQSIIDKHPDAKVTRVE